MRVLHQRAIEFVNFINTVQLTAIVFYYIALFTSSVGMPLFDGKFINYWVNFFKSYAPFGFSGYFSFFLFSWVSSGNLYFTRNFCICLNTCTFLHLMPWHVGSDDFLLWGAVLCTARCLAASLASAHYMSVSLPTSFCLSNHSISLDIAKCPLGTAGARGAKLHSVENHWSRSLKRIIQAFLKNKLWLC